MPGDAKKYADMIRHETLRVAVCGMLENECNLNMPQELRTVMEKTFLQFFDQYIETTNKYLHLDSTPMVVSILSMVFVEVVLFCFLLSRILLLELGPNINIKVFSED